MEHSQATNRFYTEVWPHAATVLRTARFLVREPADAEDLAQETMLKAFRSIDGLKEGTDAKAWLMTILRNARIDKLRSRKWAALSLEELAAEPETPAEAEHFVADEEDDRGDPRALLEAFSDQQVIDALHELPEAIRWTLLLVDIEGLDHREAAEVLGVPVGTVKSRAHRGRMMLRGALLPLAKQGRITK